MAVPASDDLEPERDVPLLVIGAGAAGLFAALAARGAIALDGSFRAADRGAPEVLLLDGAKRPGAKILVSGGGRCNVTNTRVRETDFETDAPRALRGVLAAFSPVHVRNFFASRGVLLHEEAQGKLFPDTDDARTVLAALTGAIADAGVGLEAGHAVTRVARDGAGFVVSRESDALRARRVIVATGGRSLPKSGSNGAGYAFLESLGVEVLPQRPALAPLRFGPGNPLHDLAGLTLPAILSLVPPSTADEQVAGAKFRPLARAAGSLLVTHDGASGPVALDVSHACARSVAAGDGARLLADFWTLTRARAEELGFARGGKAPGACVPPDVTRRPMTFEEFHAEVSAMAGARAITNLLADVVPRALAERAALDAGLDAARASRGIHTGEWRKLFRWLARLELPLAGTGGYRKAEVTAGGVPLAALGRTSLEARAVPGLFVCGEVVNVTGRLGGFNFQWAWSSGVAAGRAAGSS